jgi:hypothetical protein
MKNRLILLSLCSLIVTLTFSCGDNSAIPEPPSKPSLDRVFVVQEGDTVTLEDTEYSFGFQCVIWDTRCPRNEVWNWPGYADIAADFSGIPQSLSFPMRLVVSGDTSAANADQLKYQRNGFTIRFLALTPARPILDSDKPYMGTFRITTDEPVRRVDGDVMIGGLPTPGHGLSSPFYIKHCHIVGDTLELSFLNTVSSDRPILYAYMEPGSFSNTWPPSADIYFRMLYQSGVSDAFDTIPARFDLTRVRVLYREKFGYDGPLMVNLHSYEFETPWLGGDAFVRAKVIYNAEDPSLNWAPVIVQAATRTVTQNSYTYIAVHYYDPNGTEPTLSVDSLPDNWRMSSDPYYPDELIVQTREQDIGTHRIRFIASDGDLADTMYMEVTVTQ